MKRAMMVGLLAMVMGCKGTVTVVCAEPLEVRTYKPELAVGPLGPSLEDLGLDSFVAGAGDVLEADAVLSGVLVGLADGWGCELPDVVEVAVWGESAAAPTGAPGELAGKYSSANAHARRVADGLVELELQLAHPLVMHAGERPFVALRLGSGLTCAIAALPAEEPTRGWRWRPGVGWESLEADYVDVGVGVVGLEGCE